VCWGDVVVGRRACRLGCRCGSVAGAVVVAVAVATGQAGLGGLALRESERRTVERRLPGCWRGGGEAAP
jgi:hypothetical protein